MGNDNKLLLSAYFIVLSPSGEKSATAVAFLSWKKHIVINKEVNKCPSMQ